MLSKFGREMLWGLMGCLIIVLGVLFVGCSTDFSPVSYEDPDPAPQEMAIQSQTAPSYIVIAPFALTKPADDDDGDNDDEDDDDGEENKWKKKSKKIGSNGGQIVINEDDVKVTFTVPEEALEEKIKITMGVMGEGLHVLIGFKPAELQFNHSATVKVRAKVEDIDELDLNAIGGYYITKNGSQEIESTVEVRKTDDDEGWIIVTMYIDHFSIYSPWDDDPEGWGQNWWWWGD